MFRLNPHLKIDSYKLAVSDTAGKVYYDGSDCEGERNGAVKVIRMMIMIISMKMLLMMMMMKITSINTIISMMMLMMISIMMT